MNLTIQSGQILLTVMHDIRDVSVGDDRVLAIGCTVIKIEEPLGFPFTHHEADLKVGAAHLHLPGRWIAVVLLRQATLTMLGAILRNGGLQLAEIL